MPVNIDKASKEDLMTIPGIGPAFAENLASQRMFHFITSWKQFHELTKISFEETARLHSDGVITSSMAIFKNMTFDMEDENAVEMAKRKDYEHYQDLKNEGLETTVRYLQGNLDRVEGKADDNFTKLSSQMSEQISDLRNDFTQQLTRLTQLLEGKQQHEAQIPDAAVPPLSQSNVRSDKSPKSEDSSQKEDSTHKEESSFSIHYSEETEEDRTSALPGGRGQRRDFQLRGIVKDNIYIPHDKQHKLAGIGRGGYTPTTHKSSPKLNSHNTPSVGKKSDKAKSLDQPIHLLRRGSSISIKERYYEDDDDCGGFSDYSADEEEDVRVPQGYSMDSRNVRLDPFEGKLGEWDAWFHKFKFISRACRWTQREKLFRITTALTGAALNAHMNLPASTRNNFDNLCKFMQMRYGTSRKSTKACLRAELENITQKHDEDLEVFADRVMKLAVSAYPKNIPESSIEFMAVDKFMKGCRDKKTALLSSSVAMPETMFEAVEHMRMVTATAQRLGVRTDDRHVTFNDLTGTSVDPSTGSVRSLSAVGDDTAGHMASSLSPAPSVATRLIRSEGSSGTCNTCGGRNHYSRECPNNRRRSPSPLNCYECSGRGHIARECVNKRSPSPDASRDRRSRYNSPSPTPRGSDSPNWRDGDRSRRQDRGSPRPPPRRSQGSPTGGRPRDSSPAKKELN